MTQNQYDRLKPLELYLEQSTHNYLVNQTMANKQVVFTVCKELGIQVGSITCASCVLKAFQRVADLFFSYQEQNAKSELVEKKKTTKNQHGKNKNRKV